MELTVCPPTSAQCLPTSNCPTYVFQMSAQHLPNICPMSAICLQCLPYGVCSRCLPNIVCAQILDFILCFLFFLQKFTDRMNIEHTYA